MYKHKYNKYKSKYIKLKIELSGGNQDNDIVNCINDNTIIDIQNKLPLILKTTIYCDKILGSGLMGTVAKSVTGDTHNVAIDNIVINMPIVVKEANQKGIFDIKIVDDILYIYSYLNLTSEVIILAYISKLWRQGISPHLPYMVGFSSCREDINTSRIITERHGLNSDIKVNIENTVNIAPFMFIDRDNDIDPLHYVTSLSTLYSLLEYVKLTSINGIVTLPNNEKCDVAELCDYLTISYLHTFILLSENNITLLDMHFSNIFLHWLHKNSYCGTKNIKSIKHIAYKISKNKYIHINTYGLILKIGDVGASIVQPKKDVVIIGFTNSIEKSKNIIPYATNPKFAIQFLYRLKELLPQNIYKKTVVCDILSHYPYTNLTGDSLEKVPLEILKVIESPSEILAKFKKYTVDRVDNKKYTLII